MNPALSVLPPRVVGGLKYNWEDLTGVRFGRLTCVYYVGNCRWVCRCDCNLNTFKIVQKPALRNGHIISCGCVARERSAKRARKQSTKHGLHKIPEYNIWHAMWGRCENTKNPAWRLYGARGIRVCKRWETVEQFLSDMGRRPSSKHQIDRINNDANYCPDNCRWVLPVIQANNTSRNRFVEFGGERLTIGQWATKLGISYSTLHGRIHLSKWPIEAALNPKLRKGQRGPY